MLTFGSIVMQAHWQQVYIAARMYKLTSGRLCMQMSKAEKARQKKLKAQSFAQNKTAGKVKKNSSRWG